MKRVDSERANTAMTDIHLRHTRRGNRIFIHRAIIITSLRVSLADGLQEKRGKFNAPVY